MANNDYFAHVSLNGDTLVVRAQRQGFLTFPLGENIAAGFDSVRTLSLAWFWYVYSVSYVCHLVTVIHMCATLYVRFNRPCHHIHDTQW